MMLLALLATGTADHPVTLRPRGLAPVTVRSVRYTPPPGTFDLVAGSRCRVVLTTPGRAPVSLETIGTGEMETVACIGLAAVGLLPGPTPRIGLVYDTASPNFAGRTPVVLGWDRRRGTWNVDQALSLRLGVRLRTISIAAMRRALGGR